MFDEGETIVSPYGPGIVRGLERWKIDGKEVELLTVEHLLFAFHPPTPGSAPLLRARRSRLRLQPLARGSGRPSKIWFNSYR
jgi:hypothetical protein